jgi:hypothetical protein
LKSNGRVEKVQKSNEFGRSDGLTGDVLGRSSIRTARAFIINNESGNFHLLVTHRWTSFNALLIG